MSSEHEELVEDCHARLELDVDAWTEIAMADRERIVSLLLAEVARAAQEWPTDEMQNAARDGSRVKYGKSIGSDAATWCWTTLLRASPLMTKATSDAGLTTQQEKK